jgi:hypothetical protein
LVGRRVLAAFPELFAELGRNVTLIRAGGALLVVAVALRLYVPAAEALALPIAVTGALSVLLFSGAYLFTRKRALALLETAHPAAPAV